MCFVGDIQLVTASCNSHCKPWGLNRQVWSWNFVLENFIFVFEFVMSLFLTFFPSFFPVAHQCTLHATVPTSILTFSLKVIGITLCKTSIILRISFSTNIAYANGKPNCFFASVTLRVTTAFDSTLSPKARALTILTFATAHEVIFKMFLKLRKEKDI